MINEITLRNFKCFGKETIFPLGKISLLCGINGRGKSSLIQSLLLLSQTYKLDGDLMSLRFSGPLVEVGSWSDAHNIFSNEKHISLNCKIESRDIKLKFRPSKVSDLRADLDDAIVDGWSYSGKVTDFDGSNDGSADGPIAISSMSDVVEMNVFSRLAYLSAERFGAQNNVRRNQIIEGNNIGIKAENLLYILDKNPKFVNEISASLSKVLGGATLQINGKGSDYIELKLNSVDGKKVFKPSNVGIGYSFALPVIALPVIVPENSILIIENPEAHLHPAAQARLTEFLIEYSVKKNLQLIIETHSDHIVNGLRIAVKKNSINRNDVSILHFERANDSDMTPNVKQIKIDSNGTLSEEPDDFLDEWTRQLLELV